MSSEFAIKVEGLSKCYQIYDQPRDRLKQFILPGLQRMAGRRPKQYFGEFWALRDVSFEVKKGETVGIIGHNGSGKSTLLQMICGTLRPTCGEVRTNGRVAALLELGSGFNPEFTGRENVYLNGSILGLSRAEIDAQFDYIAAFADIGDFIERPVKTYSSGMMVRLAFAVSVAVRPDILIVDEALAVGDEAFQRKCFARIEEIKKSGGTILFVTHATQLILEMCSRTILLHRGDLICYENSHRAVNLYYKVIGKSGETINAETLKKESTEPTLTPVAEEIENFTSERLLVDDSKNMPTFDESLASPTRHEIHEEKYGISISGIRLQDMSAQRINVLIRGGGYVLVFDVSFTRKPNNITYQVLFKTVNGIPVAGDRFLHEKVSKIPPVAGNKLRIQYEFKSLMNPGVYFVSIEACGDEEGKNLVYHKLAEVLAFRVLAQGRNTALGYASVMSSISVEYSE